METGVQNPLSFFSDGTKPPTLSKHIIFISPCLTACISYRRSRLCPSFFVQPGSNVKFERLVQYLKQGLETISMVEALSNHQMQTRQESRSSDQVRMAISKDAFNSGSTDVESFQLMKECKWIEWDSFVLRTKGLNPGSIAGRRSHRRKVNLSEIVGCLTINNVCSSNLQQSCF
jgi:hypothetical protein